MFISVLTHYDFWGYRGDDYSIGQTVPREGEPVEEHKDTTRIRQYETVSTTPYVYSREGIVVSPVTSLGWLLVKKESHLLND